MQGQTDEVQIPPWTDLKKDYPFIQYFQKIFRHYTYCEGQQTPQLYPLQVKALPYICKDNKNLLCISPTSSGKSFVFYMCIFEYIWKYYVKQNRKDLRNFRVIYIAPTKAVCEQKFNQLSTISSHLKNELNMSLVPFYLSSQTKYQENRTDTKTNLINSNIIICTLEMCHNIFKFHNEVIEDLKMFLVDEIHMIACEDRGYLLEIIVNRILYMQEKSDFKDLLRLVSVTASVPNVQSIQKWTNSQVISHNKRPVEIKLIEPVHVSYYQGNYLQVDYDYLHQQNIYIRKKMLRAQILNIIKKFEDQFSKQKFLPSFLKNPSKNSNNYLIFCTSRIQSETSCKTLCQKMKDENFKFNRRNSTKPNQSQWWGQIKKQVNMKIKNVKLKQCIEYRVAFHHASLSPEQKQYVLELMKNGWIIVIFCTTTLAQGVNLPVRAVIIMDVVRSEKQIEIEIEKPKNDREREQKDEIQNEEKNQQNEQQNQNQQQKQQEQIQDSLEILYKNSDIDQMIGRGGRNKRDRSAYCAILGHHSTIQKYLQPLRKGQSIQLQSVQSKLMDKFQQFVIFQSSYMTKSLTTEYSEELFKQFSKSLWAETNHNNLKQLKQKLKSTKNQFDEYKLDFQMLHQISSYFITFQSYKEIYVNLRNWDRREYNFYEDEQKFLRMACSVKEIIIPHKADPFSDKKKIYNGLIKVPYPWKDKLKTIKKQKSITKAVFLVQVFLKGEIEKLNDNYALKMDCYEIIYFFKQVCKLIHYINFRNQNLRGTNIQSAGIVFWCEIYLKYCTFSTQENLSLYRMMENWYSHLNIEKCKRQMLAKNNLADQQFDLKPFTRKKQVKRWGFFQIVKLLRENKVKRIKDMVLNYKIIVNAIGENFQLKLKNHNESVKFYIFQNINDKYQYRQYFERVFPKNRKYIIIVIFGELKGIDTVLVLNMKSFPNISREIQLPVEPQPAKSTRRRENRSDQQQQQSSKPTKKRNTGSASKSKQRKMDQSP